MNIIDLDYIADDDEMSVSDYIETRIEKIKNSIETLNSQYNFKNSDEYDEITYQLQAILTQLNIK